MDLTLPAGEFTLNIRVHIIIETENGFLFFKSKGGHFALVGGRVKAGESSLAAAQRELEEETGLNLPANKFKLISNIENFYGDGSKFHEIGFMYLVTEKISMHNIPENFVAENNLLEIPKNEILNYNILPAVAKEIILDML
jgi:8-oxo-dGTP pyrophosphatase MutT (NUDIX family)